MTNTAEVTNTEPDVRQVVWKLEVHDRDLDSNIIALPPGGGSTRTAGLMWTS
ncbi:hypothetical protein I553_1659 [Mycobacterium xenopi 4042]|uniref:Uncharacterized protein n=1 Tax=Mycobacterium xenopi 4042 TaxID=1299334 RepID=X8CEM0_MYCXE|nr:hypothetical protein I553_1659 [Mycobacterium xenopi 4042]